jgi:hypothetical protein
MVQSVQKDKSRSGHIELSGLEHMFRKVARKLGIPDSLKLYCARHTFGTVAMAETSQKSGTGRRPMGDVKAIGRVD